AENQKRENRKENNRGHRGKLGLVGPIGGVDLPRRGGEKDGGDQKTRSAKDRGETAPETFFPLGRSQAIEEFPALLVQFGRIESGIGRQELFGEFGGVGFHGRSLLIILRSWLRPLWSRDLTVPMGQSSAAEISSKDIS